MMVVARGRLLLPLSPGVVAAGAAGLWLGTGRRDRCFEIVVWAVAERVARQASPLEVVCAVWDALATLGLGPHTVTHHR